MAEIAPAMAEREKTLLRLPPCPDNYRAWPGHHLVTLAARVDPGWQTVVVHRAKPQQPPRPWRAFLPEKPLVIKKLFILAA
jgi:hypothetical protein